MSMFRSLIIANKNTKVPLTFTAETAGSTVVLNATGNANVAGLLYRYGTSGEWSAYTPGTVLDLPDIGDSVQMMNTERTLSTNGSNYVTFAMTGKVAGSGNTQSLLNWRDDCYAMCYIYLFRNCTGITEAPELPATTLGNSCYQSMFQSCTSLTKAPELPATTLKGWCYSTMFKGCTSLTKAPELPATTLARACYGAMFQDCSKLTKAPELPATPLVTECYVYMFTASKVTEVNVAFTSWLEGATTSWLIGTPQGTFYKPEELPEVRGASNIPTNWTIVNK